MASNFGIQLTDNLKFTGIVFTRVLSQTNSTAPQQPCWISSLQSHIYAPQTIVSRPYQPLIVCDPRSGNAATTLAERYSLRIQSVGNLAAGALQDESRVVAVLDLLDQATVRATRRAIGGQALPRGRTWAFAVPTGAGQHAATTQANALGATEHFDLRASAKAIGQFLSIARTAPRSEEATRTLRSVPGGSAIIAAGDAIAELFSSLSEISPIKTDEVNEVGLVAVRSIAEVGAASWLETVRAHHGGTFQHCLLVTGTAAAFAAHHRMDRSAAVKLTCAAVLHDIGKAAVPLHILDKPGRLTDEEFAVVKSHPDVGYRHLLAQRSIDPLVLDAVRHHHEAMDGSGYPDGLRGSQITLLTRILTVCDVYAALIEARPYKKPLTQEDAVLVLVRMSLEGKLDYEVVRQLADVFAMRLPGTLFEVRANLTERDASQVVGN